MVSGGEGGGTVIAVSTPFWRLPEEVARRPDLLAEAKLTFAALAHLSPADGGPFHLGEHGDGGLKILTSMTGIPMRSLQRAIVDLETVGLLGVERRRGATAVYRVLSAYAKLAHVDGRPSAAILAQESRRSGEGRCAKMAQHVRQGGAGRCAKVAQHVRQGGAAKTLTGTDGEQGDKAPSPSSCADPDNGNGDGGGGDARLLDILRCATGRLASNGTAGRFLEAVREARAAGATDSMIATCTLEAGDGPPWAGPNGAREAARALLTDFARLEILPAPKTVADALKFLDFCRERLASGEGDGESRATWNRAASWADRHAEDLRRAATWPEPAAVPARGAAP